VNNRTIVIITAFVIGAAFIGYYFFKQQPKNKNCQSYRIAIFEPASHPAMDEIAQGFIETLQKNSCAHYTFKRYNANGNNTLLRALAEEIVQNNYDLIMTIGADPTRTIHELTSKKNITTPVVFDAVSDPIGLGIIASRASSGNNITGVEEIPNFNDQLNRLLLVKPDTKNLLLVYDPIIKAGIHETWAQQVQQLAHSKSINVHYAKVFHTNEIQTKVQPLMQNVDVIMIFTDHTTVSGVDSLITLCNRYGVTLYASDLNSGDKGAALSYGIIQYDLGADAGQLALQILEKHKDPKNIPITEPTTKRLKINSTTAQKQGLALSDAQLQKIKKDGGEYND
jgi:putative ABC transport system substrate-binding protein